MPDLPYPLHTNRELGLMLADAKPLAMFADIDGQFPPAVLRYIRMFDRHVTSGRFTRRDHRSQCPTGQVSHRILFASPGEEWRIDAMLELKRFGDWTRDDERREGELLGYADWMNDYWLTHIYRS